MAASKHQSKRLGEHVSIPQAPFKTGKLPTTRSSPRRPPNLQIVSATRRLLTCPHPAYQPPSARAQTPLPALPPHTTASPTPKTSPPPNPPPKPPSPNAPPLSPPPPPHTSSKSTRPAPPSRPRTSAASPPLSAALCPAAPAA